MTEVLDVIATLTVKGGPSLTKSQRKQLATWLRSNAKLILKDKVSKTFRARFHGNTEA